jgi:protein SCO1/2
VNTNSPHDFDLASRQRGIRRTVIISFLLVLVVIGLVVHKVTKPQALTQDELREYGAVVLDKPRRFSDFELQDNNGQRFTREQLQGQWSLLFFGFTHCPDICPMALLDLQRMVSGLPSDMAADTQVILVTLDPARDTPEELTQYLAAFNKDFIGVTGEFLTLRRFANEVNVAFAKVMQGEDYTVDHSGNIVLINPMGDYHGFFRPPFDVDKLQLTFTSIYQNFDF